MVEKIEKVYDIYSMYPYLPFIIYSLIHHLTLKRCKGTVHVKISFILLKNKVERRISSITYYSTKSKDKANAVVHSLLQWRSQKKFPEGANINISY
jgi:hypothetical protein